ncbi:uncharacterized protein [Eurosta solidaginis]|uniref:uncharacterized protein isoform X2 n=1 Tax=Eurosta solidaginis TaxID=178769 RepID=UPI003530DE26
MRDSIKMSEITATTCQFIIAMDGSVYCRTCAAPSPEGDDDIVVVNTKVMSDIFANKQINKLLSTLKEWQLDILEDDGLPQCICETCELELRRIDDFRQQALRAKEYLRRRLNSIVNCVATTEDLVVEVMKINSNEKDLHASDVTTTSYDRAGTHHGEAIFSCRKKVMPPKVTFECDEAMENVNNKLIYTLNNNNRTNLSNDNGSMRKEELNVVNEQTGLNESSRPPKFQIVLIEEHAEAHLEWITEEDEPSFVGTEDKTVKPMRNNEIPSIEMGLAARTECIIGDNNNNKLDANQNVLMKGEEGYEGKQINTNKNNAICNKPNATTYNECPEKCVTKNSSNKQAQGGVVTIIKNENSQHENCVQQGRETEINNNNAKTKTEHIFLGITQHENYLNGDEEDSGINDQDSYLADDSYTDSNSQYFQGVIWPLEQQHQTHSETNDHDSYFVRDCDSAQCEIKCADSSRQNFRRVISPLQQEKQSQINSQTNFTFGLMQSPDESISEKYTTIINNKSPGMHNEITTTEIQPKHIRNNDDKLTNDDHMQIKEFQTLFVALNEQISTFETNKETNSNLSNDHLDLDLQSIFMNDLTLQVINANVNIVEEDLQIDELETLLSLPVVDVNEAEDVEDFALKYLKCKQVGQNTLELAETSKINNEANKIQNFPKCAEEKFADTKNTALFQTNKIKNKPNVEYSVAKTGTVNKPTDQKHTINVPVMETSFQNDAHEQFEEKLIQSQLITSNEVQALEKYADDDSGIALALEDKQIKNEPLNKELDKNIKKYLTLDNIILSKSAVDNIKPTTTTLVNSDTHNNINKSDKNSITATCLDRRRLRHRNSAAAADHTPHNKKNFKNTNILRCRFCVYKQISEQPIFATTQLLDQHIATVHDADKERPYNCSQCAARYRTRSGCVAHINAIHLKKFDNCKLCNKNVAGGSGQMRMHIERNHTHGNYTCEICHLELKNVTLYNFKYHKRWHDERKLWRCKLCEKAFVTRTHLTAHQVTHTRQGEFLCTHCGKKFTQHIQKRAHLERYHPNEPQSKRTTVPCTKCDKQFSTEVNLQRHIKKHHNEGSFDVLMKKVAAASATPQYEGFMCAHCPRKYRSKYALIKHLRVHTKMPDKPYSCPDCFMHFKHFSELDRHDLQHHATVRPYKCDECSKRFSTRTALKIHRQIHEVKGRNFRCPECDQRFKFEKSLNLHRISHKTMRHSCDICNKSYIRLTQLKTHKNRYHQIQ